MGWVKNRDTVTDWGDILMGANLPRGIQPSDIDGILEVRGKFLVMEKKNPNEPTKQGQNILLNSLSKVPCFTVIKVIHGQNGVEEIYNYKNKESYKTSPAEFIQLVERWAWKANNGK